LGQDALPVVNPELPDPVAFLSPGFVHQLGNLLFTIQGHAIVLDDNSLERGRAAIANACERGSLSLRLFRHLLGEPGSTRLPAVDATVQLLELLRVPVREAGHTVDHRIEGNPQDFVELGSFVPAVVGAIQALVAVVPHGVAGHLHLVTRTNGTGVHVALTFRASAGNLPFPLAIDSAAARVRQLATRKRHAWSVHGHGATLDVGIPMSDGVAEA
jgi:hypothetical protein